MVSITLHDILIEQRFNKLFSKNVHWEYRKSRSYTVFQSSVGVVRDCCKEILLSRVRFAKIKIHAASVYLKTGRGTFFQFTLQLPNPSLSKVQGDLKCARRKIMSSTAWHSKMCRWDKCEFPKANQSWLIILSWLDWNQLIKFECVQPNSIANHPDGHRTHLDHPMFATLTRRPGSQIPVPGA